MRRWAAAALLVSTPVYAWGTDAHAWLAEHALAPLTEGSCLSQWYRAEGAGAELWKRSMEPDQWRSKSSPSYRPDEGPMHYLDLDAATPPESFPKTRAEMAQRFGPQKALKLGGLPWRVEERVAALEKLFAERSSQKARLAVVHLSHYVSDGFSPLHATVNHDPAWGEGDQIGLHERYEELLWRSTQRLTSTGEEALRQAKLEPAQETAAEIFSALQTGLVELPELVAADRAAQGELDALFPKVRPLSARRWAKALSLTASLVQRAWQKAGAPRLPGMKERCEDPK